MQFLELLVILFMIWVIANVVRAVLFRTSKGGGFWGLYNQIIKEDAAKDFEAAVQAEVKRRAEQQTETAAMASGKQKGEVK